MTFTKSYEKYKKISNIESKLRGGPNMKFWENYYYQRHTLYIDSEADVSGLPTHASADLGFYSTAIVAETGNVYILKSTDEWILFGGET